MERLIVTATLRQGAEEQARRLVEAGPPFDLDELGLTAHAVYLTASEVVFVFEGEGVERAVSGLVDDPVVSASFAAWAPLTKGTPRIARRVFSWERGQLSSSRP